MASKNVLIVVAVVAILAIAAAALIVTNQNGGNEEKEKETVTITDLAGREVTLSVPVDRIVCGDAETMPMIAAVAGESFKDKVVGYDSNLLTYYPDVQRMWESGGMDFSNATACGSFQDMNFNWEVVISLNPDVVFIPTWCYVYGMVSEQTVSDMAAAGVPIVNLDIYMNKLDPETIKKDCDILGVIFDNKDAADKLAAFYEEQVNKVDSKLSEVPKEAVTFYFEMLMSYESYGSNGSSSGTGKMYLYQKPAVSTGSTSISPEAFMTMDIDVAFLGSFSSSPCGKNIGWGATVTQADIDEINENLNSKRSGWSESKVVQDGEVYVISMTPISTMDVWFLYQFFAQVMFPDLFSELTPLEDLESFYTDFIPWIDYKAVLYFSLDGSDIGMIS